MEVYAWGSGSYGRLGLGHTRDAAIPQRVSGVLNGCDVRSGSCGWYHSAVVTSTGDVATFGSKVTKCLGAAESDASSHEDSDSAEKRKHDRVEDSASDQGSDFTGAAGLSSDGEAFADRPAPEGVSRAGLRRRGSSIARGGTSSSSRSAAFYAPRRVGGRTNEPIPRETDYLPHVIRSFPSRVTIVQVAVGGDMLGAHTLAVSRTGRLYSWGYGPACGLGSTANVTTPTLVTKFLGFGPGEQGTKVQEMEPMYGRHSHARYRSRTSFRRLGLQLLRPRIVKVVCGGGFSGALSSDGEVFTFGLSVGGRLGFRTKFRVQLRPRRIETLKEPSADIAAGAGFMLLCSASGRLISWGDNAKGQLGIGHLQESYEPRDLGRVCPAAFVFKAIAAGDSHSLALDSAGHTYSWGGEGGPMTGQGQAIPGARQVDAAFQFRLRVLPHWWVRPCQVRALFGMKVAHIAAGCLHSVALTQDGVLFAWGALLQAASSGSTGPEVAWVPRLLAPSPKLPLVRITSTAAGGWHSMATAVPSCAIDRLLPGGDGAPRDDRAIVVMFEESLFDGFITSRRPSSSSSRSPPIVGDNAATGSGGYEGFRVYLSCAAVRARLALPDGNDSPVWKALSVEIQRRGLPHTSSEPTLAHQAADVVASHASGGSALAGRAKDRPAASAAPSVAPAPKPSSGVTEDDGDDSDEQGESLMDIIAMRDRAKSTTETRAQRHRAGSSATPQVESPADEAAGKALKASSSAVRAKWPATREKAAGRLPAAAKAPHQQKAGAPQPKAPPQRRIVPEFSSDSTNGEEGEAVTLLSASSARVGPKSGIVTRNRPHAAGQRPIPIFSSDSSSSSDRARRAPAAAAAASARLGFEQAHSASAASGSARPAPRSARSALNSKPLGGISAASSSSSVAKAVHSARSTQALPQRRGGKDVLRRPSVSVPKLGVELSEFGEVVLAIFVRFLHTDYLGTVEVIDEEHPLVQLEQQQMPLRLRRERSGDETVARDRSGSGVAQDVDILADNVRGVGNHGTEPRASQQRASEGLMLRSEVDELRCIGRALGLERLVRLCDQLLLRIDAPGAPALFVPSSTLGDAMGVLLRQALAGPSQDGTDTRILCGSPSPRRRLWGHRVTFSGGQLWAHAFVLCGSCNGLGQVDGGIRGVSVSGGVATRSAENLLRRCASPQTDASSSVRGAAADAAVRFELDLQDFAAEVVFAWLRYLYVQEDLSLLWPCSGAELAEEDARVAERFWMCLLRLAQRLGDWRMELYAQDTLIGALSVENWSHLASFADQVNCRALSEAALMMGVRRLLPAMLRSFKVPTGLESAAEQKEKEDAVIAAAAKDSGNLLPTTQPVSPTALGLAGRGTAAHHGQVELELERRLLSLHTKDRHGTALLELKRSCPGQFSELKHRLSDSIKSAQQVAEQLQRCARFFDSPSYESGQDTKAGRRILWAEIVLAVFLIAIICVAPFRKGVYSVVIRPLLNSVPARKDLPWPFSVGGPLSEYLDNSTAHFVVLNGIFVLILLVMLWSGLKSGF